MVFTNITPFPTTLTPLTNISPLTYRDAGTFLEYLETIKQWLNETLVPETDTLLENAVAEFQAGIANAEATITDANADNLLLVNQAIEYVNTNVANINALMLAEQDANKLYVDTETAAAREYVDDMADYVNNKTGNVQIQRVTLTVPYTLNIDPMWPTNHPVNFVLKQDAIGGHVVTLGNNIAGPLNLNMKPNAITEFILIPNGDGTWKIRHIITGPIGNGVDDTASLQAALNAVPASGGKVVLPSAFYKCAGPIDLPANVELEGFGGGLGTEIEYTGSGVFITPHTESRITDLKLIHRSNALTFTLVELNNVFRTQFTGVTFGGNHLSTNPAPNGTGLAIRGNAGDSQFVNCRFQNLGTGVRTDSIMNYLTGCVWSSCQRGIWGDAGSFGAGMSVDSCTFVSNAATTIAHIQIDVNANRWWISNTWFEGSVNGVVVGLGANGPQTFGMVNCMIASTTACIVINSAKMPYLANISFSADGSATPTELTINAANSINGTAINLQSGQNFDIADSVYPAGWTVMGRGIMHLPPIVHGNIEYKGSSLVQPNNNTNVPFKVNAQGDFNSNLVEIGKGGSVMYRFDQYSNFSANGGINIGGTSGLGWSGGIRLFSGAGAPTISGIRGDYYFRNDNPGAPNQRIYVCDQGGGAGVAVWVGIV